MKILRGFSEETAQNKWVKAEVEVTEDDLTLLLAEAGLQAEAAVKLTAREKFLLLNSLAEVCLLEQRVHGGVESTTAVTDRLGAFMRMRKEILDKLKATYVPF